MALEVVVEPGQEPEPDEGRATDPEQEEEMIRSFLPR
jgi:hypothetical protein